MATNGNPGGNESLGFHVEDLTRILWLKSNHNLSKENKCAGPRVILKMILKYDVSTKKWQFNNGNTEKNNKVIVMIGESGSGKTTLINALVNYIFGVQWKYDSRIQLVGEDPMMVQDPHHKSRVMVYQINHQPEFCIPHSLTIIDTPGLPQTQGVTPQSTAVQQIRELFYNSKLDHIDAICFVTQSSMTDLSLAQAYMFDSLTAMFGPKVQENIVIFMTSADDEQRPPALATMIRANVPCAKDKNGCPIHFKLNNSVLYVNIVPDAIDTNRANELQWISGMEDVNNFVKFLSGTSRKTIVLQKNILMQSNASEITVDALVYKIEEVMSKLCELEQIEKIIKRHKVEIEKNEYFEFEVDKSVKERINTQANCTNCHECNSTCHHNCLVAYDTFVYFCEVFYFNASCRVCEHGARNHFSEKFLWKNQVINTKVTYWSIKKKYKRDDQEVLTYQMVLDKLKDETEMLRNDGSQLILRASDHIRQFTSVASSEEFVDKLIDAERRKKKYGFQERIKMLEKSKIHFRR